MGRQASSMKGELAFLKADHLLTWNLYQISWCAYVWTRLCTAVFEQHFWVKEAGCTRLRESFTGVGFSITDNWQIINHISKCSIPVFEGFLPAQHNENLMGLLFTMAHWHALAKLRQHTDLSLDIMDLVTIQLGTSLRKFQAETCFVFNTRELKREEAARTRQAQRAKTTAQSSTKTTSTAPSLSQTQTTTVKSTGRHLKTLNLKTYKDHALGDYVETIRRFGTTDSYSTETVSFPFCVFQILLIFY